MSANCFIGVGEVALREFGSTGPFRSIENSSKLDISFETDKKTLPDYTQPGGGVACSIDRVKSMQVSITNHAFSAENLAIVLFGALADVAAATVTDEAHAGVKQGELIRIDQINPATVEVTNDDGTTTYAANTDYVVSGAGVKIVQGGGIADDSDILIDYAYSAARTVEILAATAKEYELVFDGINEASGKPAVADVYRVKFGLTDSLSLIGDDFGALTLNGEALSDGRKTGVGISRYGKFSYTE